MTLNELKYIIAIAKYKHFRKAAEACFVSQPTLSIAIKKIEEELNVQIFERHKQSIIITPIGKQILEEANQIHQHTNNIKKLALDQQNQHTELRIGAIYTIGPTYFPKFIPILKKQLPKTNIYIEENFTHILTKQLREGKIDVIFISTPFNKNEFNCYELYQEDFIVALSKEHPLVNKPFFSEKDLQQQNLFLLGEGHCFRDQILSAYSTLDKINPSGQTNLVEGSSLETIRLMVQTSKSITLLPCTTVQDQHNLVIKKLNQPTPSRTVVMAWRKSFKNDTLIETLKRTTQEIRLECVTNLN